MINTDNLFEKIEKSGFEWLSFNESEAGSDLIDVINKNILRERNLLSSVLIVKENAMEDLEKLMIYLHQQST